VQHAHPRCPHPRPPIPSTTRTLACTHPHSRSLLPHAWSPARTLVRTHRRLTRGCPHALVRAHRCLMRSRPRALIRAHRRLMRGRLHAPSSALTAASHALVRAHPHLTHGHPRLRSFVHALRLRNDRRLARPRLPSFARTPALVCSVVGLAGGWAW
jgi:hypothetical protein